LPATEGRKRTNASKLLRGSKTNPLELLMGGRNPLTMQTEERRQSSPHRRASCRQKQRRPRTLDRPDGQAFRTQKLKPFRSKFLGIPNFAADIADSKNHLQERTNASSSSTTDSFQKVLTIFNTDSTQTPPSRHLIVNERDQRLRHGPAAPTRK
jgi:hypothetical protein